MFTMSEQLARAQQLAAAGRSAEAEQLLRWALSHAPADPDANRAMGMVLLNQGRPAEAAGSLRRAADAAPLRPELWYELGMCHAAGQRPADAIAALERAQRLAPQAAQVHELLGQVLFQSGQPRRACEVLARGLELDPRNAFLAQGRMLALKASGRVAEAAEAAQRLADDHPDDPEMLLLAAWQAAYWSGGDPARMRDQLERRGRILAAGAPEFRFANTADPERKLRVGFLCQDIQRDSPIARFVAAPLLRLDPQRFEVLGYCTQPTREQMSPHLLQAAEPPGWLDVSAMDDPALVDRLRADRLDILIETAGNTAGHRQPALSRRAAPVQVTCIGDPRTTGNPAVDFRLVDAITDPPGSDGLCTERLVRLPGCFLCYEPHPDAPLPRAPFDPARGPVTFGSFNVHDKTGPEVIDLWARILRRVEGSRLVIKSLGLRSRDLREHFNAMFRERGVDPLRVELAWEVPAMRDHLLKYLRIDIALDTFPYNGTTTTCDALWAGVPVVTRRGSWHAARVGASLLSAVGLAELVAESDEDYIRLAADLASNHPRLAELHRTLRARVRASPLLDAPGYGHALGEALRAMWRSWCAPGTMPRP